MGFKNLFPSQEDVDWESWDAIEIYTDGSCIGNGSPNASCGWAYLFKQCNVISSASGGWVGGTNNQAEMIAVYEALKCIPITNIPITIYSDSRYVVETLKGNYTIGKNHDLWSKLKSQFNRFKFIRILWVKGHSKNEHNNTVDQLANQEAKSRMIK